MNQAQMRAPWEFSKAALSLAPIASNSAQSGAAVDRTGYDSLIADYAYDASGAPTGGTLTLQLQDSADGVTFVNFGASVAPTSVAAGGVATLALDIRGARQFVRVVSTAAPTGGASPVVTAGGVTRLYGPSRLPAL